MNNNIIISIGRQFGSGGHEIGKKLADLFGFEYYDNKLITLAAKEIGFAPECFENVDEKPKFNNALRIFEGVFSGNYYYDNYFSNDMLFKIQSEVILKLAEEKSCVFIGRCSDYILRNNPNVVSIFIHSSISDRTQRICKRMNVTEQKALELVKQFDKRRAAFYNYYSNKRWGYCDTYNISVDASVLGDEQSVDFLAEFIKKKFKI
ncbi:MAG: cytidylate kinase-like family protein [Prevotellaceae bacterium]|jgi:cytidylate kinase|nr:cytidylate kinase-like family protein [Prevotellaceae bacterium]